jgi:hypothetical protein
MEKSLPSTVDNGCQQQGKRKQGDTNSALPVSPEAAFSAVAFFQKCGAIHTPPGIS